MMEKTKIKKIEMNLDYFKMLNNKLDDVNERIRGKEREIKVSKGY